MDIALASPTQRSSSTEFGSTEFGLQIDGQSTPTEGTLTGLLADAVRHLVQAGQSFMVMTVPAVGTV